MKKAQKIRFIGVFSIVSAVVLLLLESDGKNIGSLGKIAVPLCIIGFFVCTFLADIKEQDDEEVAGLLKEAELLRPFPRDKKKIVIFVGYPDEREKTYFTVHTTDEDDFIPPTAINTGFSLKEFFFGMGVPVKKAMELFPGCIEPDWSGSFKHLSIHYAGSGLQALALQAGTIIEVWTDEKGKPELYSSTEPSVKSNAILQG